MLRAIIDERLAVRVVSERRLCYAEPAAPADDRPDHVRSASDVAMMNGRLFVIQDDASFVAVVDGDAVSAIALPHAPNGRRRFETGLGNKLDKLDLEACVVDPTSELLAFGSGSLAVVRERICRIGSRGVEMFEASELYERMWLAVGYALNIEGAALVGDELWLFHRGNVGPSDPGPAIIRMSFAAFRDYLNGARAPRELRVDRVDLGRSDHVDAGYGFTGAAVASDGRVFIVCVAEASSDAIADGPVSGSRIGVIDVPNSIVRCTDSLDRAGKIEGLVFDPQDHQRGWITFDPDDIDQPAPLCAIALVGPWRL